MLRERLAKLYQSGGRRAGVGMSSGRLGAIAAGYSVGPVGWSIDRVHNQESGAYTGLAGRF